MNQKNDGSFTEVGFFSLLAIETSKMPGDALRGLPDMKLCHRKSGPKLSLEDPPPMKPGAGRAWEGLSEL